MSEKGFFYNCLSLSGDKVKRSGNLLEAPFSAETRIEAEKARLKYLPHLTAQAMGHARNIGYGLRWQRP